MWELRSGQVAGGAEPQGGEGARRESGVPRGWSGAEEGEPASAAPGPGRAAASPAAGPAPELPGAPAPPERPHSRLFPR